MPKETDPQTNNPSDASALPGPLPSASPVPKPSGAPVASDEGPQPPPAPGPARRDDRDNTASRSPRSDFASKTNAYLLDYIKFADTKAGAILTFAGLVGGGIASTASKTLADSKTIAPWAGWCAVAVLVAVLACAIVVGAFCLRALTPRSPTAASLTSFPDIANMPLDQYATAVAALSTDEATAREYAKHNWTLSRVAKAKFDSIETATRWVRWMLVAGVAYVLIVVAIAVFGQSSIISL